MQLTEIKNDLATMNYNPELNRLMISDFILIEDSNQSILAQIISIEGTDDCDVNSAMLKFLLSIDKDANLTQYLGYVPAKNATLLLINPREVVQLIKSSEKNIYLGNLASYPDIQVELGIDFLRKKPYIQVDFLENKLQIVEAIIRGLSKYNKKTLLLDFSGLYSGLSFPEISVGDNFKLPLNYEALCHISEEELNDCNNDNRATIQAILLEIQNYVKTTEDGFIPFNTFISVLDSQYEETSIPELLLLKNKLMKYQQQGIFAQNKSEFDFINDFLKENKNIKFNLSELPTRWHKTAFVSILNILKIKCYMITDFTDDNSNKTTIKKLYEKTEIKPIVISSYNYKYQIQLKAMSKNMILFKPQQKVNDFAGYTSFLNILGQDTFIVWGEQTLFIPLILKISNIFKKFEIFAPQKSVKKEPEANIVQDFEPEEEVSAVNPDSENSQVIIEAEEPDNLSEKDIEISPSPIEYNTVELQPEENIISIEEPVISNDEILSNESASEFNISEDYSGNEENIPDISSVIQSDMPLDNNIPNDDNSSDMPNDINSADMPNSEDMDFFFSEDNEITVQEEIAQPVEANDDFDTQINNISIDNQIDELPIQLENDNGSVSDFDDLKLDENLNEVSESTDKSPQSEINTEIPDVVTPVLLQTNEVAEEIINTDNTISANDDNINVSEAAETVPQQTDIPETNISVKSANIPVYNSNIAPQFDAKFAQGTYVHHPKYGRGVVEKVINYGEKQLCLIIFDNEGRKLLDPNIADLKQV